MRRLGMIVAGVALLTAAACGADDREMDRPRPDQTTTSLVRGTTTTLTPPESTVPPETSSTTTSTTSTTMAP